MMGSTHMVAGAIAGTILASSHLGLEAPLLVVACAAIGGLVPDIDSATSKLGRKVQPVSLAIQLFIGHRTLFHSPLLYAILFLAVRILAPQYETLALAAVLGAGSHILLDALNSSGVPLLWPIKKRFHIANFKVFGLMDWCLFFGMTLLLIYLLNVNGFLPNLNLLKSLLPRLMEDFKL